MKFRGKELSVNSLGVDLMRVSRELGARRVGRMLTRREDLISQCIKEIWRRYRLGRVSAFERI